MGSKRLPRKMSLDICGYDMVDWVIRRCLKSELINKFYIATSSDKNNQFLIDKSGMYNISYFAGSENDVLSRFTAISKKENPDLIVRICADNPLISAKEIDRLIKFFLKKEPDYAFNHIPTLENRYVDGVGAEVLSLSTLIRIANSTLNSKQKEHVTKYIWDNLNKFDVQTFLAPNDLRYPNISLDIDNKNDYAFIKKLVKSKASWNSPEDISIATLLKTIK